MILPALLLAGDAWTYDVSVRYDDREGPLLRDRERWTVRVLKGSAFEAERSFIGTVLDDDTLIRSDALPEIAKGEVGRDGTLKVKGDWSDPAANRALRRLLAPVAKDDRVAEWPVVRHLIQREADILLPESGIRATLTVETTLISARLGGRAAFPKSP